MRHIYHSKLPWRRIWSPAEDRNVDLRPQYSTQESAQGRPWPVCHDNQVNWAENTIFAAAAAAAACTAASAATVATLRCLELFRWTSTALRRGNGGCFR